MPSTTMTTIATIEHTPTPLAAANVAPTPTVTYYVGTDGLLCQETTMATTTRVVPSPTTTLHPGIDIRDDTRPTIHDHAMSPSASASASAAIVTIKTDKAWEAEYLETMARAEKMGKRLDKDKWVCRLVCYPS